MFSGAPNWNDVEWSHVAAGNMIRELYRVALALEHNRIALQREVEPVQQEWRGNHRENFDQRHQQKMTWNNGLAEQCRTLARRIESLSEQAREEQAARERARELWREEKAREDRANKLKNSVNGKRSKSDV